MAVNLKWLLTSNTLGHELAAVNMISRFKKLWFENHAVHSSGSEVYGEVSRSITFEQLLRASSETWTITNKIQKSLDGCYTRMLRAVYNVSWKDKMTIQQLYGNIPLLSQKLKE